MAELDSEKQLQRVLEAFELDRSKDYLDVTQLTPEQFSNYIFELWQAHGNTRRDTTQEKSSPQQLQIKIWDLRNIPNSTDSWMNRNPYHNILNLSRDLITNIKNHAFILIIRNDQTIDAPDFMSFFMTSPKIL